MYGKNKFKIWHLNTLTSKFKLLISKDSLVVQWLRCAAFNARVHVLSLVGELRSHKPCNVAKKKKIKFLISKYERHHI